jgi:hypothetical protein
MTKSPFLPPGRTRNGDYQRGYAIRDHGYLTFTRATAALYGDSTPTADSDSVAGSAADSTRGTLDRLLAPKCSAEGWY